MAAVALAKAAIVNRESAILVEDADCIGTAYSLRLLRQWAMVVEDADYI